MVAVVPLTHTCKEGSKDGAVVAALCGVVWTHCVASSVLVASNNAASATTGKLMCVSEGRIKKGWGE